MNSLSVYKPAVLIGGLALLLRMIYVFELSDSPLFEFPAVDADTYNQHAEIIAKGNWLSLGMGPFWQPPLFPYSLAPLKIVFSDALFFYVARIVQALVDAFTCVLVYFLGTRLFNRGVGIGAGLVLSAYGPMIFFVGELLPATTASFLNMLGLLLLLRAGQRPTIGRFLLSGFIFGLSCITVPTVLPFCVVASAWIAASRWAGDSAKASVRSVILFVVGVVLPIAPVTIRNYVVGNDLVLISYNGGINFYIGNNGNTQNTLGARPGWEWDDLVDMPMKEGITKPSDTSSFFYNRAWKYIEAEPLEYVTLTIRKAYQFWHGDEVGRNQAIYYWRNYSNLLSVTLCKGTLLAFPFGLIAPLAFTGLSLLLVRFRTKLRSLPTISGAIKLLVSSSSFLVVLFAVVYVTSVIAFFPTARYRIPVVPVLGIFAVFAVRQIYLWVCVRTRRSLVSVISTVLLLVVSTLVLNYRLPSMDMDGDALIHYNIANAQAKNRESLAAIASFERAVTFDPEFWQAWINLGSMYAMNGSRDKAIKVFENVRDQQPNRFGVWINLAHAYRAGGQMEKALNAYERSLDTEPVIQAFVEYISLCLELKDYEGARNGLQKAVKTFPQAADRLKSFHARQVAQNLQR